MIETDQQERRDRGQFPEDEEHQEAVGHDKPEHRSHEHQDEREEPSLLWMAFQVTA